MKLVITIFFSMFGVLVYSHDITNHDSQDIKYYIDMVKLTKANATRKNLYWHLEKNGTLLSDDGIDAASSDAYLGYWLQREKYWALALEHIEEKYPNPALQNESYEISSENPKTYIKLAMRRAQSYTLEQARTADIFTHDHHDSYIENPTPQQVRQVWANHIFEMWSSLMASNYSYGEVHYEREYLLDEFKKIIEPHITQEKLNEYIHYLTNDLKEKELNSESWYANIPEDYKKVPWLYKKHILDKGLEEYAQWDIRGIDRPSVAKAKAAGLYVTPTITVTAEVKEDVIKIEASPTMTSNSKIEEDKHAQQAR